MFVFFFFNDPATTEIYPLPLHDALPICCLPACWRKPASAASGSSPASTFRLATPPRSEEHTSELQSQSNLVCRLLLEKKKTATRSVSLYISSCTHTSSALMAHTVA